MNALSNKVQLIGNLGINPEMKVLDSGKKLAKFSLATYRSYKNDKGEKITKIQWHNLVAWGNTADYIEKFLKKGMQVAVGGKILNKNYTDKAGVKRHVSEIQVSELFIVRK